MVAAEGLTVYVAAQEIDAPGLAPAAGEQPRQAPASAPAAVPVQAPHSASKYAIFLQAAMKCLMCYSADSCKRDA